jgi:hypothetical protein
MLTPAVHAVDIQGDSPMDFFVVVTHGAAQILD